MDPREAIAIIGMGGVFPAAATPDQLWDNLLHGVGGAVAIPPERWSVPAQQMLGTPWQADRAWHQRGCPVAAIPYTGPQGTLPDGLLPLLDPLYHLTLHAGHQAYQSCRTQAVAPERCGVVLAAIALPTDSSSRLAKRLAMPLLSAAVPDAAPVETGAVPLAERLSARVTGLPAALLARALGLGGMTITLDAACASSLYALHLACDALLGRRADLMLAGGVSRPDCLYTQVGFSQLRALSATGRCTPFDAGADGLVVGEGAGILALKRLSDAAAHKDRIWAVIRGWGLSNDLRGNLLAPDSQGQLRAMQQAYEHARLTPGDIDHIECHGAGTPVGDAIELESLQRLWAQQRWRPGQCVLGSVKSHIGHLLTAAGAAGTIKTALAMAHGTLPPTLGYQRPASGGPLDGGPFRVLAQPEPWLQRDDATPRRAAVSAFGFGGINAHLILEEFDPLASAAPRRRRPQAPPRRQDPLQAVPPEIEPVAIVGLGVCLGDLVDLASFERAALCGQPALEPRPPQRWTVEDHGARQILRTPPGAGNFITRVTIHPGTWRIPPNEIPDLLPQHLLMLQVAAAALSDAGLSTRQEHPELGVLVGIDFDAAACRFQLRWQLEALARSWLQRQRRDDRDQSEAEAWIAAVRDMAGPPLTASRTLGALGSLIASRLAREFRCGGASFTLSAGALSGLVALESAVRLLHQGRLTAAVVGAVDLAGDLHHLTTAEAFRSFSGEGPLRPFDSRAGGTLPADGAAAVVIKRLRDARADGDRVYAVIRGLGAASGPRLPSASVEAYMRSLQTALDEARLHAPHIDYLEAHGSGDPQEDAIEAEALAKLFPGSQPSCALGSLKAVAGHAGAAAGLASVVKTALCLQRAVVPPLPGYASPAAEQWRHSALHVPHRPQVWLRDRAAGPRRAVVAALDPESGCCHVVLEDEPASLPEIEVRHRVGLSQLCAPRSPALFVVPGAKPQELLQALDQLEPLALACSQGRTALGDAARQWHTRHRPGIGVALLGDTPAALPELVAAARQAVSGARPARMAARAGVHYSPQPPPPGAQLALVYPGSGSHYPGMGRELGLLFPELLHELDGEMQRLRSLLRPWCHMPWRLQWPQAQSDPQTEATVASPLELILGQIGFGLLATRVAMRCGLQPDALVGYSLGESTALAATGIWPDRDGMLAAVLGSELFTRELAGECRAARQAWRIGPDEPFEWCAALVNRPAQAVKRCLNRRRPVRLLIVNGPEQCVVGGHRPEVERLMGALDAAPVYIEGSLTVHCDALAPVAEAWRRLHRFPTRSSSRLRVYGGAPGPYHPSPSRAAASILRQGLRGLDFTKLIHRAWQDGIRCFVEVGPQASCSAMIQRILADRPHLALSLDTRGETALVSLCRCFGSLAAEGVAVDLAPVLERLGGGVSQQETGHGGEDTRPSAPAAMVLSTCAPFAPPPPPPRYRSAERPAAPAAETRRPAGISNDLSGLIAGLTSAAHTASQAHQRFLMLSAELTAGQARLIALAAQQSGSAAPAAPHPDAAARFSRAQCLEFAVGSAARVLGPGFAALDRYPARVRLPAEPLMLVDRILQLEGRARELGPGRIVTEHDVRPGSWYLDGDRAPAGIAVEAGQADLFLCSYLGIDLRVQGRRNYRLLDATVTFHRGLPRPGETIRYDIRIERFIHHGDAWLFFFSFTGTINDTAFISMQDGCAGFFTPEEVHRSGGILPGTAGRKTETSRAGSQWRHLTAPDAASLDEAAVAALQRGDLFQAFGREFRGLRLGSALRLPSGRLGLVRRVPRLEPRGGHRGLGLIQAETDIHPDDWFLTCHFIDDMTMPGTLMYEGSLQALRILLLRQGLVSAGEEAAWEPLPGSAARLKCRGPVTPLTKRLTYELEITELGFAPEPYALADALLLADGRRIVRLENISLRLTGCHREQVQRCWTRGRETSIEPTTTEPQPVFSRGQILAFALGNPSEAFGEPYRVFDRQRVMARLPNPPYLFMDRVEQADVAPWILQPGGWITAAYDVPPDAWYFRAEGQPLMPYAILNEVALQPCGWLAAWMGSALKSPQDLKFRNLGGRARLQRPVTASCGTLRTRTRLTQVSQAGDLIIEHFEFQVHAGEALIYEGQTSFGFFTSQALAAQVGLRGTDVPLAEGVEHETPRHRRLALSPPLSPDDPSGDDQGPLRLPAAALAMISHLRIWPGGGAAGLGFVRAEQNVEPSAWYFKAHFFQDPVCPGSLGLESLMQVLKALALERWPHLAHSHAAISLPARWHQWTYRGQVLPSHRRITVEAAVTEREDGERPRLVADGRLLVDGLPIYAMTGFGLELVPRGELRGAP
jgi:acyl transferase domain-containing protein/3-hydroxymyristoyl/3-hydroxydecanoyl-(acyl carrier protein) dehydratase